MNILIIRLSAIGDVAMTIPVIDSVARKYPDVGFTVISQSFLAPLFSKMPRNVQFVPVYTKDEHKGIRGIYKLFKQLRKRKIDTVADLHDVLRSKLLRFLFLLTGAKVKHIDKGRKEKKELTRRYNKHLHPVKNSFLRYKDVFLELGLSFDIDFISIYGDNQKGNFSKIYPFTGKKNEKWIGIAPFAKHTGKIYPLSETEKIIHHLSSQKNVKIFLFGGGAEEQKILSGWAGKYPGTFSAIGNVSGFEEELIIMSYLDVMISMDSANMHLASLVNTPVVSVWGATHPYTGFYGWNQRLENAAQIELDCRPCSIYGNKPCFRKDYACMNELPYEQIVHVLKKYL